MGVSALLLWVSTSSFGTLNFSTFPVQGSSTHIHSQPGGSLPSPPFMLANPGCATPCAFLSIPATSVPGFLQTLLYPPRVWLRLSCLPRWGHWWGLAFLIDRRWEGRHSRERYLDLASGLTTHTPQVAHERMWPWGEVCLLIFSAYPQFNAQYLWHWLSCLGWACTSSEAWMAPYPQYSPSHVLAFCLGFAAAQLACNPICGL